MRIHGITVTIKQAFLILITVFLSPWPAWSGGLTEMVPIPFTVTVMGVDQDPASRMSSEGESTTLYQRRMNMPWSKEAFL